MSGFGMPWTSLINNSFQNLRNGLNTLSYGIGNAGQIYGSGANFNPGQLQQPQAQTNTNNSTFSNQNLSNIFKPKENYSANSSILGNEIENQAPGANKNLYDYLRG